MRANWLRTERLRTNYQGQPSNAQRSRPFGDGFQQDSTHTQGAAQDDAQFTGQEWEAESATTHFQYRQYSATQGRWMSPDPYSGSYNLFDPQTFNRYACVLNNPLSALDPYGLCDVSTTTVDPDGTIRVTCIDFSFGSLGFRGWLGGGGSGFHAQQKAQIFVDEGGGSEPTKPTVPSCSSQNLATRTLSRTAAFTNRGLLIGGSLSGSFEPVSVGATIGYYADPSGTVNRVQTYAFSGALGAGIAGGVTFGVSNYKDGGHAGWSDEFNASAGWGPNASATWSRNSDGSGVSLTLGGGAGVSVGGGRSYTVLTPVCKVGG